MTHTEQVYGSKEWPSFWKTIVESKEGGAWYKEQMARFSRMCKDPKNKEEVFDVDESFELGYMSPGHWKVFVKFLTAQLLAEQKTELLSQIKGLGATEEGIDLMTVAKIINKLRWTH